MSSKEMLLFPHNITYVCMYRYMYMYVYRKQGLDYHVVGYCFCIIFLLEYPVYAHDTKNVI